MAFHSGCTGLRPAAVLGLCMAVLAACGGSGDDIVPIPSVNTPGGGSTLTAPVVVTQPASVSVAAGGRAQFTVVAQGDGIAYAWFRSTSNGASWAGIAGADKATLSIDPVDASMNGQQFRVVLQNGAGSVTSNAATLTVTSSSGGGGSGGNGTVPTTCVPANVLPVGTVIATTSVTVANGVQGSPLAATETVVGPSSFQGQAAFETRIDSSLLGTVRAFSAYDPDTRVLTPYGSITHIDTATASMDTTSVARQPAVYPLYTLAQGASATETAVSDSTQVITLNGVAQAPVTSTQTLTTTYTFLGTETLSVPAGTFLTCKYREESSGSTTTLWQMVGYGATVRMETANDTQQLTAFGVNGAAVTQFP